MIHGNTTGLKSSQLRRLERIYRRRIPSGILVTQELGRYLTELSQEIGRQIGIIVDREGTVQYVIVGDEREIVIPVLENYPLGRKPLRGVRCIHTHLKDEPLSQDDLTDLALLRLDMMTAIGVGERGLPAHIYNAHLVPLNPEGELYRIEPPRWFHALKEENFSEFISALEEEMGRVILRDVDEGVERAILVSVGTEPREEQMESLSELRSLAETSGVRVVDTVWQRPKRINPKYLVGEGKIKEIIMKGLQKGATMLIFDRELSPTQVRELGKITELKVIDRTQLILDIFARRALSRDGKVQVELAQLRYLLPKLTGKGTALSRLAGGIGGRGPGETKLEIDRRRVLKRIAHLERELEGLKQGRLQRRKRRARAGIPIVSIVGYTNAGKSTLLNALTESETLVEDKLFATLDTATRRLRFPEERECLITDTVGFIQDLPAELKKAFRATLEEMEDADLLIHLVDISHPQFKKHIEAVERILEEIGLLHIPRLLVFNKIDLVEPHIVENLSRRYGAIPISAKDKNTLKRLLEGIEERLWKENRGAMAVR